MGPVDENECAEDLNYDSHLDVLVTLLERSGRDLDRKAVQAISALCSQLARARTRERISAEPVDAMLREELDAACRKLKAAEALIRSLQDELNRRTHFGIVPIPEHVYTNATFSTGPGWRSLVGTPPTHGHGSVGVATAPHGMLDGQQWSAEDRKRMAETPEVAQAGSAEPVAPSMRATLREAMYQEQLAVVRKMMEPGALNGVLRIKAKTSE